VQGGLQFRLELPVKKTRRAMSILFQRENGIAVITINRPEARNAIDEATATALSEAISAMESDPQIRVGIITGAAGHFCAGMDLKAFLRKELMRMAGGFAGVTEARLTKPLAHV
jgi:enoyl-CoA hydratase